MVRQRRIYHTSAVYHVTFRGNNKQKILKEKNDKESFLLTLGKFKQRYKFKLYGLCLMDNHAHLVIESIPPYNISQIMQSVLLSYSLKFRRKYKYSGHVWQGRFNSNIIEGDSYILECLEYIHNNPVKVNIAETPGDYPWSSFYLYDGGKNEVLEKNVMLDRFGDTSNVST